MKKQRRIRNAETLTPDKILIKKALDKVFGEFVM